MAVNGSYYVQLEELDWLPFALSIAVGLLATAILVVNNLRDIETDRRAGKITLAVRLGRERTRLLYASCSPARFAPCRSRLSLTDAPGLVAAGASARPPSPPAAAGGA